MMSEEGACMCIGKRMSSLKELAQQKSVEGNGPVKGATMNF